MTPLRKIALFIFVLLLTLWSYWIAILGFYFLLTENGQDSYRLLALFGPPAAVLGELLRTYWTAIHSSSTIGRPARYMTLQFIGMAAIPLLAYIGTEIDMKNRIFSYANPPYDYTFGGAFGAILGFAGYMFFRRVRPYRASSEVVSGSSLVTPRLANHRAKMQTADEDLLIPWGGITLPDSRTDGHFCIVGASGSGKTATMNQFMKAVLPKVGNGKPARAMVYDAKRDVLSVLKQIGVEDDRIRILNPFDARSDAWDMARDVTSPSMTGQVASIFIPKDEGPNRYFSDAARAILAGVMDAFVLADSSTWTLRDVVIAMQDHDRLKQLLSRHPGTRGLIGEYFSRVETMSDIRSTIASHMSLLKPIAALWSRSTRKFSIEEWVTGDYVLVLGNDDSVRAQLDALNRVLFQRISEVLTRTQDVSNGRSWIFLDELKEGPKLDGLSRLLTKGRSFGVRVVIGFQDLSGLTTVYNEHAALEIANLPMNKAFLRLESPQTADWAAKVIGEAEFREFTINISSREQSYQEHINRKNIVLASELQRLPPPNEHGFTGYFVSPVVGIFKNLVPYGMPKPKADALINFRPRSPRDQYLDDWNDDDLLRLGFLNQSQPHMDAPAGSSSQNASKPLENPAQLPLIDKPQTASPQRQSQHLPPEPLVHLPAPQSPEPSPSTTPQPALNPMPRITRDPRQ